MTIVHGQFDLTLTTPVSMSFEIVQEELEQITFDIDTSRVMIRPLKIKEGTDYNGDVEPPRLIDVRVWIIKEAILVTDTEGQQKLSGDEEVSFEKILIEAVRRFVTLVKLRTDQWSLDTRYPVYSYKYAYFLGDDTLDTSFPLSKGSRKMPEYFKGRLTFETYEELTIDAWRGIVQAIGVPTPLPIHEEFLYDARIFRDSGQYHISILFAAVAVEVILEEVSEKLLKAKGTLTDSQCDAILSGRRVPSLVKLVKELEPSIQLDRKNLEWLLQQRNKIAHGKTRISKGQDAGKAIGVATALRRQLSEILNPIS